jgi:hypothetical protein
MTYARWGDPLYKYGNVNRLYGAGVEDSNLHWIIEVDWNGDGSYDGSNENEYARDMKIVRGRRSYIKVGSDGKADGFEPVRVGYGSVILDNSDGRYDPYNSSSPLYPNVLPGRFIRIRQFYSGTTYPVFHGKIKNIIPFNTSQDQRVRIEFEDGLRLLQAFDSSIAIEQNLDIDDAIGMVLDEASWPTLYGRNIEDASDVLSYWWANDKAVTEIQRLTDAELGTFFVAADGNATFYSRHHSATAALTLDSGNFLKEIEQPQPWEVVRNIVRVIAHPRVLRATSDLWTIQDKPLLAAGDSLTVWATYQYNNNTVPAINVIEPVATTDYTANTQEDGGGVNLTASFSITTFTDFGQTAKIVIRNNHGSLAGYITLLKVRGDAVDAPDPSLLIQEDTASQALYDKQVLTLDNIWLQSTSLADDFSRWLISFMSEPQAFLTVQVESRPDIQFSADLFDIINVTISKLSIARNFKVGGMEMQWTSESGQSCITTWFLEPFADTSGFWIFDSITGNVTMGVNTVFGL